MSVARGEKTPVVDRLVLQQPQQSIIIDNVSILSADGEMMLEGRTVQIDKGRIVNISLSESTKAYDPKQTNFIDGSGKFLIPGLVDSHVHLDAGSNDLLLYLANGVTYVRDMGGNDATLKMRNDTIAGQAGPDMFVSGPSMSSETGRIRWLTEWTRDRLIVNPPDAADAIVTDLAEHGYDSLKINSALDQPTYLKIAEAASLQEIIMLGHIPHAVGLKGFWDQPLAEVAHIEEFTKMLIDEYGYEDKNRDVFLEKIQMRAPAIGQRLRELGIPVQSTLWLIESLPDQKHDLANALKTVKWEYANPGDVSGSRLVTGWIPGNNHYELSEDAQNDPTRLASSERFWNFYVEALHIMARAFVQEDVIILAGTDAGSPLTVPGFSLHDELESLVQIGMSNTQALKSATVAPNRWTEREAGKIALGQRADLLLLLDNPLDNIANTRSIETVIRDGRAFDREELDRILGLVLKANNAARKPIKTK